MVIRYLFFGLENPFYRLLNSIKRKSTSYIKNRFIIPCVDNLRFMLQEYLGDYGFKLRLLEPCCPEEKLA